MDNALKGHHLYHKDRHYMIAPDPREQNQLGIIIIDEFTGRAMFGRQWSDGLHQAVEAKHKQAKASRSSRRRRRSPRSPSRTSSSCTRSWPA